VSILLQFWSVLLYADQHQLAKTYHQALMNDKALQSLEKGSLCLNQVQESDAVSLTLKVDGLILKGDLKWQTKKAVSFSLKVEYLSLH
jgi:hypothetical protein